MFERRLRSHEIEIRRLHPRSLCAFSEAVEAVKIKLMGNEEVDEELIARLLQAHWTFMSRSFSRSRATVALTYSLGLGSITFASVSGTIEVMIRSLS